MKRKRLLFLPIIISVCATATAAASVINLFSNTGDQSIFGSGTTAITNPIPDPLTGAGWGVMSNSGLGGDALSFWDSTSARATVRYHTPDVFSSGVQFSFNGLIESGGPEGTLNLWRIGSPAAPNLAGGLNAVVSAQFTHDGFIKFGTQNAILGEVDVGLNTPFSFSVVFNATAEGGSDITYDQDGLLVSLSPQFFSMYINDNLVGVYESNLKVSGIEKVWFLTGNAGADSGPTMQIGSYDIRTGASISAIPEPRSYAVFFGIAGLGLVMLRRRRQS